jgi:hypothetical protein
MSVLLLLFASTHFVLFELKKDRFFGSKEASNTVPRVESQKEEGSTYVSKSVRWSTYLSQFSCKAFLKLAVKLCMISKSSYF